VGYFILLPWIQIRLTNPDRLTGKIELNPDQRNTDYSVLWIRIKVIRLIRNRIRIYLQMTSQNVWNISIF
jgi:hypothetical protein